MLDEIIVARGAMTYTATTPRFLLNVALDALKRNKVVPDADMAIVFNTVRCACCFMYGFGVDTTADRKMAGDERLTRL